jgi:hypothetical protein
MRQNNAGCLTGMVAGFSRIFLIMIWISRPLYFNAAFSTIIFPCLGFLFLPFTTLMYVFLIQGVGGIQGIDWLWLVLAVLLDLATISSAGYANRERLPGYPGTSSGPVY